MEEVVSVGIGKLQNWCKFNLQLYGGIANRGGWSPHGSDWILQSFRNLFVNWGTPIFLSLVCSKLAQITQCDEMIDNRAAFQAYFVDLWVLSRFLIISEFHVLIFVQLVTDLVKYLRLAVGKCVSNKIWNKLYSILLWKWQQWMDKTFRQPLQILQSQCMYVVFF